MKKKCFGCGSEFSSNYPHAKFCKKECRYTKCEICGKLVDNPRRDKKTCSNKCRGVVQKTTLIGKNNPNFGNKWSEEQRQNLSKKMLENSETISERVKKDWENNQNRKEKQAERAKLFLGFESGENHPMWGKTHTDEVKLIIGNKSKQKFTDEFKLKFKKTMEENGHWVPDNLKTDYEIYFKESNWIEKMFDIVPNGLELLNEHGIFHAVLNTKGVVRDHIVGRKFGFKHRIFPEIIRHPVNCTVILHKENVSKGQRGKGRPDSDMSLEELFNKIICYEGKWSEQELCLKKISDYLNGNRWERHIKNGEKNV